VPQDVAQVIARAVTSWGSISFPVGPALARTLHGGDAIASVHATMFQLPRALLGRRPARLYLCSTRTPELALHLFTDPDFPWHLQGQIGILTMNRDQAPALSHDMLLSLLDGDWARHIDYLTSSGVIGLLRPGVDGDVAGLFSFTSDAHQEMMSALEHEARRAGLGWILVSEPDFAQRLTA
jgi:hypothetical protein